MKKEGMKIHMVDLIGQYNDIKEEIDSRIQSVLDSAYFIGGPEVANFSKNLAEYLQVKHVIPCGNGTDALQLAIMALDLSPGDQIITTPFTFVATAEVVKLLGLECIFVDVNPETFNIDIDEVEKAIGHKTKCIVPVHLFGQPCDMAKLMDLVKDKDIAVIEDNAQAIGSYCQIKGENIKAGGIGHLGTTSFFPSKNLGCFGDGGAIMTNDDELASKVKTFANHGSQTKYYYSNVGINSRLDAIQAVILDTKLKHLDNYIAKRIKAADRYDMLLDNLKNVIIPVRKTERNHVFHQYTLKLPHELRERVVKQFKEENIPFGIYYPLALHEQEAYNQIKYSLPIAEKLCKEVISLPMHTNLNVEQQEYIVNTLVKAIK